MKEFQKLRLENSLVITGVIQTLENWRDPFEVLHKNCGTEENVCLVSASLLIIKVRESNMKQGV